MIILILLLITKLSFNHRLKLRCQNRKFDNYTIYLGYYLYVRRNNPKVARTMCEPGEHENSQEIN